MLPKGFHRNLDYGILLSALALSVIGLVFLFTMSYAEGVQGPQRVYFFQQMVWFAAALCVGAVVLSLDYRLWARASWLVYAVNIGLLAALLIFGERTHGAESWFSLGLFKFQPSELAKILFIITFAHFLARYNTDLNKPATLAVAIAQFAAPLVLILLQPDVGTALVFLVIFFVMLFTAGLDFVRLLIAGAVFVSTGIIAVPLLIKDYQLTRLTSFLHPVGDTGGAGWQLHQAQVAMGSGGLFGRGLFHGTQATFGFLPAAHTDFIFSAICEQAGFAGGAAVLLLFLILLYRIVRTAARAEDLFAMYIASGVFALIAFQAAVNIGMSVGVFPITGVPLPFVSYGGSSLLTLFAAVALVLNVSVRRKKLMFR